MHTNTIDTATAKKLATSGALRSAAIIGQPGGWCVLLKIGMMEKPLGTQRADRPRTWRSLDNCVSYLKNDLKILRFDMLDASQHSDTPPTGRTRADASERLKLAHQAAAHAQWFREQVEQGIAQADAPSAFFVEHAAASRAWAKKRSGIEKSAVAKK